MSRLPILFAIAWLAVCPAAHGRLRILTTFLPAFCAARNVAGDLATVENLLPGSVSPHDYQLTPQDVEKLTHADLVVMNGLGLESWMSKALRSANVSADKTALLSAGIKSELIALDPDQREPGESENPHIWLDPLLYMRGVTNVLAAITKADPANELAYRANAAAFIARLQALDFTIASRCEKFRDRAFVTSHDAFPYFVRHFNLRLAGVVERVSETPPTPRELAALLRAIRSTGARAVFTEPDTSPRLARLIAHDAGLRLGELSTLETGRLDPGAYEAGMLENIAELERRLQ